MTTPPAPAPAADDHDHDTLFGAPELGMFDPAPVVYINGFPVSQTVAADWTEESTDRVALDGVTITWGRSEVLDQPDPATGSLRLFDLSGTFATSRDLRGLTCDLYWRGVNPADGTTVSRAYFRGRIGSPVRVSRKTVQSPDGTRVVGSLVELPLVSILVDLANQVPTTAWPAETLGARRARVETAAAAALPGGVETRSFWHTPEVPPVAAKDQVPLYEHLVALYDSSGADRVTYLPHERKTTYVIRRDFPTSRGMATLWWNTAVEAATSSRAGKGVYARALNGGHYIDASALEYPAESGITSPDKITRVRLTHQDSGAAYADRTVELSVDGTNEARDGIRTVSINSLVAWNAWADVAASDLEELSQKEAAEWRLEPLTWRTRLTGGFESYAQAVELLTGAETPTLFFLQGSYLPPYGMRPIFGVMGQTITYADGGWELEFDVAPLTTTLPQHAITWEEFDNGTIGFEVRWHDDDNPRGMHESLTYEDLAWVSRGLAVSTEGPDTGWDFLP